MEMFILGICDSNYNCILTEGSNGVPKEFDKVFAVLKKIGLESKGPLEPGRVTSGMYWISSTTRSTE